MDSAAAALTPPLLLQDLGIDRLSPDIRRGDHEPPHPRRVPGRGVQRHAATERVADDVRPVDAEVVDQRGDVVGHQPHVDGSIDVRRAPVSLQVESDDLVALGQQGQDRPEHLARPEPAVK
jgi:hypothetical protein